MKNKFIKLFLAAGVAVTMGSCKDFQDINKDPNIVPEKDMQIDYMLNSSIYKAQMDPNVAERMFLLTWSHAARYERSTDNRIVVFQVWDDYFTAYWGISYMGGWLRDATIAVQIGENKIAKGLPIKDSERNLIQISRIWRAYLYGEFSDNFGPVPISQYDGQIVPEMKSVQDVYAFILTELEEASLALNKDWVLTADQKKNDPLFAGDIEKWQKYANSMSLRYALRIGNRAAFEAAAARPLISAQDDIASVQEKGGWDPTTGNMTLDWSTLENSLTYANITTGLGGVTLTQLAATPGTAANKLTPELIAAYSKDPQQYIGLRMQNYLPVSTNVGNAGYFMDYIPSTIDPRAMVNLSIPGHNDGTVQNFPYQNDGQRETRLLYANGEQKDGVTVPKESNADTLVLRGQYSYLALAPGSTGNYSSNFASFTNQNYNWPAKSAKWRDNNNKRVFFGPWETYFLIAEAATKGWTVPMGDQEAYEDGVRASFAYFNIAALADSYLASQDYSRVGTSVAYSHTAEATPLQLQYVDLDSNLDAVTNANGTKTFRLKASPTMGTVTYNYPKGAYATNNDKLTKIITQKYIANSPWLPLEAWSDYRRLNLPFFENPLVEKSLPNMPWYSKANSGVFSLQNVPQRTTYPSELKGSNKAAYNSGVALLGAGGDVIGTPLPWAKK